MDAVIERLIHFYLGAYILKISRLVSFLFFFFSIKNYIFLYVGVQFIEDKFNYI